MKSFVFIISFPLLAWSDTPVAEQQALNAPPARATALETLLGDQLLPSNAAEDVKSLVRKHIADVTASLAEQYLRDLIASGIAAFGTNESVLMRKSHAGLSTEPVGTVSSSNVSADHDGMTQGARLLPPRWPSSNIKPLIAASCPCNCDNPKTPCCIKICVNHSKLRVNERLSPSAAALTETEGTQESLAGFETSSVTEHVADPQMRVSCPCNCDNPTTPCCIKICVHRLTAIVDQQLSSSAVGGVESSAPHTPMFETGSNGHLDDASTGRRISQPHHHEAGAVALRSSTGNFLMVEAGSDLNLYASFISDDLVNRLGLTSETHAFASDKMTTVVINGQSYQVVGTVPITIEAYTRKNFSFEDLFYVVKVRDGTIEHKAPELVLGIDHLRQAGGLALKSDLFS